MVVMRAFFSFRSEVAVDADALSDLLAHAANSTSAGIKVLIGSGASLAF